MLLKNCLKILSNLFILAHVVAYIETRILPIMQSRQEGYVTFLAWILQNRMRLSQLHCGNSTNSLACQKSSVTAL